MSSAALIAVDWGSSSFRAWRAVLPPDTPLFPVGGITPEGMADYLAAGVAGFGLGSALYRAGDAAPTVAANAHAFAAAYRAHRGEQP